MMKVIAVVDPNALHRNEFAKTHSIPENMQFASVEDFVASGTECDIVINTTIDNLHCRTTKPLLEAGYDVLMDRENVIVKFENGSVGSFDLIGAASKGMRHIHIVGENGEIIGYHGDGFYTLRRYDFKNKTYVDEKIDTSADAHDEHLGGDTGMMTDLCKYLQGDRSSISITNITDSVNGHLCVYAAEKSRKEERFITLAKEFN